MSSIRKASKAAAGGRAHKERSQPGHRARYGLLEKHKDYVLRAKDFHKKEQHIRKLKEKAASRNPDEFYFKMVHSKTVNGIHRDESGGKVYTQEELKLLRTQDVGHLISRAQSELKKVERLRSSHLPITANDNKHVYYVEDGDEVEGVRERAENRPAEPFHVPRIRKKVTEEIQQRSERATNLRNMAAEVELQKQLSGKGRKRKLRPSEMENPSDKPVFRWKIERKR